ncbi:leucine-rich repeat and WD repeat-containing protein 1 [Xenopus laevis]|uniref:Leucine-rich repeat and WD repeat-containing protein 1 n=1 Tax=Xenopus laevis TaxID=8355 RepID=LRWD1_XENLA|nr:leucine-rich repeat and WD repeat-containing protein 1 [Xenopus laevis]Q6GM71.1 RecName: Full=Leucine-rich repeat and WD repeat-containing protein 1; AltName: Full=ORC-associated protein; Short=ORCA; AltName: Full=Origin recognition complex-associated protein [Xenopus laevis]AAH74207.1 MGC82133 protein [Xenopus laevis]
MTKLTTELLLKKGLPKCSHLKDLKKLNLSKMQLDLKDLDQKLFSQMVNLDELDISHNTLSDLPGNLRLHNLRILNFADNHVEDVTVLKQFPNLEEVIYEDNIYLTVSDNYKVFCLLPKLRRLNNKDITSLANHVRFVNHRELSNRVEAYWESKYKDKLPDKPPSQKINAVAKDFIKAVVDNVRYGPSSLKDFVRWKVEMIARNLIFSLSNDPKKDTDPVLQTSEDTAVENSSKKRESADECTEGSPTKRPRIQIDLQSMPLSPRKSSRLQNSPLCLTPTKRKQETSAQGTPSKFIETKSPKIALKTTPSKKHTNELSAKITGKPKLPLTPKKIHKALDNIEPLHFLQCHSKNNSCEDFKTQLWACAFEPNLDSSCPKAVATCGGDSICIIDCETGKVMKKYKVTGEEFFTLVWTTLTMIGKDGQKRKINVLAAGGKYGVVRMIHAKGSLCYGEIKAHKKAISIMCFSPKQETFLFTGSYDKRIILWDIGVPDCDYNFRPSQLLTLDTTSVPLRMCVVPSCPDEFLVAACEDGCFAWDIGLDKKQGRRSHEVEFNFPLYKEERKDKCFHIIDSLAFLNEDIIASKSVMQGSIYLWSWEKTLKSRKNKNVKKLDAVILSQMKWSSSETPYLVLSTSPERDCVFCGDEDGKIWIYDLDSCKADLQRGKLCSTVKEPTKILSWPLLCSQKEKTVDKTLINVVTVDPTMEYLVALTDINIVSIWKIQ